MSQDRMNRRNFFKVAGLAVGGVLSAAHTAGAAANALRFEHASLQVWSCGGLAEAMMPANREFEAKTGASIAYTGAFAGALGKSLLGSGAQTEVFAPRVLELARKLKAQGKMLSYQPLCFTKYVVAVPKGNPADIRGIEDFNRPDVKGVLAPGASPPGGKATMIILKKAGVDGPARSQAVTLGDCVQTAIPDLVDGKGDAAVIEQRIARLPQFRGKLDTIAIPEAFIPAKPVPFTIGVMKWAKNREMAEAFVEFILSEKGQAHFERAGFIHARSVEGARLTRKYGVRDAG